MPVMNFYLEDGLPPVSFNLKAQDCERFIAFIADCDKALKSQQAAAPTPPTETAPEDFDAPKDEHIADLLDDHASNGSHETDYPYGTRLMREAAKLIRQLQTPPAQEAEPYAYAYKSSSDPRPSVYFEKMDFFPPSIQEIPLYTNAPSDKLRQAAEEAEQLMRGANLIVIADMLRAALEGKS